MGIPFIHGPGTVGREDRLVRGCIALSLLLLGGFAVLGSGSFTPIAIVFGVACAWFAATAALGRDPLYAHFGINTRTDAHPASDPVEDERGTGDHVDHVVDLRGLPAATSVDLRGLPAATSADLATDVPLAP